MKETICKASVTALLALLILSATCATAAAELPATFDWREVNGTNYVTPVKHQSGCSACWAFPPISIIESSILIEYDYIREIDLSEQYYISDCWGLGNCDFSVDDASARILAHVCDCGAVSEECVPYLHENSPCYRCDGWESNLWYITHRSSAPYVPDMLKPIIMEHGPVMGRMDNCYWYYPEGSYVNAHGVTIVGWNDSVGCWIIKNSWGTGWGDEGYGLASYGDVTTIFYVNGSYNPNYGPCDAYDTNGEPGIQLIEAWNAVLDYQASIISEATAQQVIDCYYLT